MSAKELWSSEHLWVEPGFSALGEGMQYTDCPCTYSMPPQDVKNVELSMCRWLALLNYQPKAC